MFSVSCSFDCHFLKCLLVLSGVYYIIGEITPSMGKITFLIIFYYSPDNAAPPKKTIDASEVKARSEKAKGALDALFASIARLD